MGLLPFEPYMLATPAPSTQKAFKEFLHFETRMKIMINEIIKDSILKELMGKEHPELQTRAIVSVGDRVFFTLKSKERRKAGIKEGSLVVVKYKKKQAVCEFITRIGKWGKINIPLNLARATHLENHETISIGIIKNKPFKNIKKNKSIDLVGMIDEKRKIDVVNRDHRWITIYKKENEPITLPRFIRIDDNLIKTIYLFHGDGHYQSKLFFSNTNYQLHNFVLKTFEKNLSIPREFWKGRVNHSQRQLVGKSIDFWSKSVNIRREKFYMTGTLSKFNTKAYGDLRIIIDNSIVSEVFKYTMQKIALTKRREWLLALNGILDAEGSVDSSTGGLHSISISFSVKEKDLFKNLLRNSGLIFFKEEKKDKFAIKNWEEKYHFIKTYLDNHLFPFEHHVERKFKMASGFLVHRYTKTLKKYLSVIENSARTCNEIAKELSHRKDSVIDTLKKDRFVGRVSIGNGVNSITKEGKDVLKIIKNLESKITKIKKDLDDYHRPIKRFFEEAKMGLLPFEQRKQEILVKRNAESDLKYGKNPKERTVQELLENGVICINKPAGPTSHQIADYVKRIVLAKRAGHSGTLE